MEPRVKSRCKTCHLCIYVIPVTTSSKWNSLAAGFEFPSPPQVNIIPPQQQLAQFQSPTSNIKHQIRFPFPSPLSSKKMIKKRLLLWDWTNTRDCPSSLKLINTTGPLSSLTNWNTWTPAELQSSPVLPFQPMIRTISQLEGEDWNNVLLFTSASSQGKSEEKGEGKGNEMGEDRSIVIHYLNEPERQNTTPEQAAKGWKEKIAKLRKDRGVKIVGPGCASDAQGEKWIEDFMKLLSEQGEEPDFMGVHYYGESPEEAIKYIKGIHEKWSKSRIAVSEIACTSRKYEDVVRFTAVLCNWMDEQEWISEYGFFGCMRNVADDFVSPAAQLMNPDGTLTDLMEMYMNEQPMAVCE